MNRNMAAVGIALLIVAGACSGGDKQVVLSERRDADHIVEAIMLTPEDLGGEWCCAEQYIAELNDYCNATHWSSRRMTYGPTRPGGMTPRLDVPWLFQVVLVVPQGEGSTCLAESLRQHEQGDFDWAPHEMPTLGDESFGATVNATRVNISVRRGDVILSVGYSTRDEESVDLTEAEAFAQLFLEKYVDIEERLRRGEAVPSPSPSGE